MIHVTRSKDKTGVALHHTCTRMVNGLSWAFVIDERIEQIPSPLTHRRIDKHYVTYK